MLRLSAPVRLVTGGFALSFPFGFAERIASGYAVFALRLSPEELLHLLTAEPEQDAGNVFLFQNFITNRVHDSHVSISLAANFLNRLLLSDRPQFTYQDSVFLSCMLQKLGIADPRQFLQETRLLLEKTAGGESRVEEIYRSFLHTERLLTQVRGGSYRLTERQKAMERTQNFSELRELHAMRDRFMETAESAEFTASAQWTAAERILEKQSSAEWANSHTLTAERLLESSSESEVEFSEQLMTEREQRNEVHTLRLDAREIREEYAEALRQYFASQIKHLETRGQHSMVLQQLSDFWEVQSNMESRESSAELWRQVFRRLHTQELTRLLERFTALQSVGAVRTVGTCELRFAEERMVLARLTHAVREQFSGTAYFNRWERSFELVRQTEREFRSALGHFSEQELVQSSEVRFSKEDVVRTAPPILLKTSETVSGDKSRPERHLESTKSAVWERFETTANSFQPAFRLEQYEQAVLCRALERELKTMLLQLSRLDSASNCTVRTLAAQTYSQLERTVISERSALFEESDSTDRLDSSAELLRRLTTVLTFELLHLAHTNSERNSFSILLGRLHPVRELSRPVSKYFAVQRRFHSSFKQAPHSALERALFTTVRRLAVCRTAYREAGVISAQSVQTAEWLSLTGVLSGAAVQRPFEASPALPAEIWQMFSAPQAVEPYTPHTKTVLQETDHQQTTHMLEQSRESTSVASVQHTLALEIQRQQAQVLETFRSEQLLQESQKSAPLHLDRARTLVNSLRALEEPEAFLHEFRMQSMRERPSSKQPVPAQTDPLTKAVLETVLRRDAPDLNAPHPGDASAARVFPADPVTAFREEAPRPASIGPAHPAAAAPVDFAEPAPVALLYRQANRTAEDSPFGSGPPAPAVQKTERTEERRSTETVHAVLSGGPLPADTHAQNMEDIGKLVAHAVSKQIDSLTERVSGNIEKRLRADRARRGL